MSRRGKNGPARPRATAESAAVAGNASADPRTLAELRDVRVSAVSALSDVKRADPYSAEAVLAQKRVVQAIDADIAARVAAGEVE